MKKELRELLAQLDAKINESRSLLNEGKIEDAEKAKNEATEIRTKIDLMGGLDKLTFKPENTLGGGEQRNAQIEEAEVRAAFFNALRGKSLSDVEERAMSGLAGADGGLVIPQDIQTMIHQIKRQYDALENYIRQEPVGTRSGSRVLEKFQDITPFADITEMGPIDETDTPQFSPITYAIKDYAGILPISNTLLADSDQNLLNYLAQWIARKSMVTRNSKIIALLKTLTAKSFDGLDSVKTFLNTGLDPALAAGAAILTNQDGYNFLDMQKDTLGRYLMQPDPTQPGRFTLFGKPVHMVANRWLADNGTTPNTAPFIVGDLPEAIVLFDRKQYEIKTTNVGGDSFKRNSTDARVIDRFDVKLWDTAAAVYGSISIA